MLDLLLIVGYTAGVVGSSVHQIGTMHDDEVQEVQSDRTAIRMVINAWFWPVWLVGRLAGRVTAMALPPGEGV